MTASHLFRAFLKHRARARTSTSIGAQLLFWGIIPIAAAGLAVTLLVKAAILAVTLGDGFPMKILHANKDVPGLFALHILTGCDCAADWALATFGVPARAVSASASRPRAVLRRPCLAFRRCLAFSGTAARHVWHRLFANPVGRALGDLYGPRCCGYPEYPHRGAPTLDDAELCVHLHGFDFVALRLDRRPARTGACLQVSGGFLADVPDERTVYRNRAVAFPHAEHQTRHIGATAPTIRSKIGRASRCGPSGTYEFTAWRAPLD